MVVYNKVTVGIFSREAEDTYQWVTDLLLSPQFRPMIQDVRPVTITSAACGGTRKLAEEISKCTFSILYHSQKRGRLNITNVTDSLYDHELRDLSTRLGREKVVVLVDDVENDDGTAHSRIAAEQPLIGELAGLLVVFCKDEKPVYSTAAEGCTNDTRSYQWNVDYRTKEKMESIRSKISSARTINTMRLVLIGCSVLGIVGIIVLCVELIP